MKRYFLDPFGCAKNQVDAENMMAHLNNAGWKSVSDAETADLIIVNSCGFIDSAKQESINAVLEWRKHYPNKKIYITGCLSQRYAKELPDILKEADGFIGIENPSQVVQAIENIFSASSDAAKQKVHASLTEISPQSDKKFASNLITTGERPLLSLPGSAYIKISEGCGNFCSYCAIPLIRGNLISRSISEIIEECKALLRRGIVELIIIGQDIGMYGTDSGEELPKRRGNTEEKIKRESKLPELLNEISKLEGNFWVRLLYIHPDHFPLRILDLIERDKRFLPYFDIPFQHVSAKILTAMNRNKHYFTFRGENHELNIPPQEIPVNRYFTLLEIIRRRLPDAVIRSTFLIGFPGESEEDFAELIDFQKKANLDWLGCFVYSREEDTASYSMKGRVPKKIAVMRKLSIEEKQLTITEKNMDRFVNQIYDVLIEEEFTAEETDDYKEKIWLGRLYCQSPEVDGAAVVVCQSADLQENAVKQNIKAGAFVRCKVTARLGFDLEVQPVNQ